MGYYIECMPMRFNNLIISGLLFSFSLLLRLPFTSKLLYHWDSVQFALAIKDYNVVLHQPQPPGYILYVLLGRGANFFIHNANSALIALSIIFGAAAVVIVFQLGQLMFGKSAGLLAAALFIFSPTVWFYSEIALSDLPDAFMATSLAFFCYKGITESNKAFLYSLLAAAALGVAGGIRQPTLILLLPLLGFTLWYSAKGRGTIIISAAIAVLTLTTASWLIPMLILTGGLSQYLMALGDLAHRIGWLLPTALSILRTIQQNLLELTAALFLGLGLGFFILALYCWHAIRKKRHEANKLLTDMRAQFIIMWCAPPLLIFTFGHFTAAIRPGYILIFLPALFMWLGTLLTQQHWQPKLKAALFLAIVASSSILFLFTGLPTSVGIIRCHDKSLTEQLLQIRHHFKPSETILVDPHYFLYYGFRHAMYYLPDYYALMIASKSAPFQGHKGLLAHNLHANYFDNFETLKPFKNIVFLVHYDENSKRYLPKGALDLKLLKVLKSAEGRELCYIKDCAVPTTLKALYESQQTGR